MKKAMMQIKKCLTNNIGLKIVSVLVAAVVWLAVVNVSDPEKTTVIYNVPITMTNEDAITDMGMVYDVKSLQYVNITISGKRSIVSNLSVDDFKATASLKELSKVNSIPVEVSAIRSDISRKITITKQSLQTITVNVENIEKEQYPIEVELTGKTTEGYVAGDYSVSKNKVNITAPASIHDRVAKVVALCNLDGSSSDISQDCILELYDKHGKVVKADNTKLSVKKVHVYVEILKEKEVPIYVNLQDNPLRGYQVRDVILSQESVKLFGKKHFLDDIEQLDISQDIDITDKTEDVILDIDLRKYIPKGVRIHGASKMQVTVKIEKLKSKSFELKTSDIDVKNLKDGLDAKFSQKTVTVTLRGENAVIDGVKTSDLSASIDLKDYDKGTVSVPVFINVPNGTELVKQVNVKIKLK